ncbi:hypothetical protein C2I27_22860 [Priestia megaterium]|uniref:hypothetical protein n=1 Tax=Priestia megaterium TaxID=1404 RepID=UPI000D518AAE|nr:hypothetical protein [Priestia megaterium]PVC63355.1 hypothetical protein C2I27_22860 [Priestia megaterium]
MAYYKGEKVVVELTAHFPADKSAVIQTHVFKLMMDAFTGIIYDDDEYALPRVMTFTVSLKVKALFRIKHLLKIRRGCCDEERYAA